MGLFGKKRRPSVESLSQNVASEPPLGSVVVSTATETTTSTRPTSLRKPPIRPQATFERVVPPPVNPNEVSILREQILDLERAFTDRDLFDFLLADIDRNRLTQIVTLFADMGRYVEMQSAMELAEKLDDLIRRRLDETHEQQRRTLVVSQSEIDVDIRSIISEAESTDISALSEIEIHNRIGYFEFHFYRFQDCDLALLLRLSECIEAFRKALRDIESRASIDTVTPSETNQPLPTQLVTSEVAVQSNQSLPAENEASPADDEAWETFTPVLEPVTDPPVVNNDCSCIYGPLEPPRETTHQAVSQTLEPLAEENIQESTSDQNIGAQTATAQDIATDTWEQFNEIVPPESPPVDALSNFNHIIDACPISSPSCDSSESMDAMALRISSRRIIRMKTRALLQWLELERENRNRLRIAQQLHDDRIRRVLRMWNSLSHTVRTSREQTEKALKNSVLQTLQHNRMAVFEKSKRMIRLYNMQLAKAAFRAWVDQSRASARLESLCVRNRDFGSSRAVTCAWRALIRDNEERVYSHILIREAAMKRTVVTTWRFHVDSLAAKAADFHTKSLLRNFSRLVRERRKWKDAVSTLQTKLARVRTVSTFNQWRQVHKRRRRVTESILKICSTKFRNNFQFLKENCPVCPSPAQRVQAIGSLVDAITVAALREKRAVVDLLLDPALVSTTPRGRQMDLFSPSMHKSPIVQYYSISDPEEKRQETPPSVGPIDDLKQTTNEIIVKTQIFLSQRRLKSVSPQPIESPANLDHSRRITDWLENHKRSSDNYFTDFERKWAIEEQKWHL